MLGLSTTDKAILVLDGKSINIRRARSFFSYLNLTPELASATALNNLLRLGSSTNSTDSNALAQEDPSLYIISPQYLSKQTIQKLQRQQAVLLTDWQLHQSDLDSPCMMTNVSFSDLLESSLSRRLLHHFIKKKNFSPHTFSGWGYKHSNIIIKPLDLLTLMKHQLLALPKLMGLKSLEVQHLLRQIGFYMSTSRGIKVPGINRQSHSFEICQDGIRNTIKFKVDSRSSLHVYQLAQRLLRLKPECLLVQSTVPSHTNSEASTFEFYFIQHPSPFSPWKLLREFKFVRKPPSILVWLNLDKRETVSLTNQHAS